MSFQIGDKVVCVDDKNYGRAIYTLSRIPKMNDIYVINEVCFCPLCNSCFVRLIGISGTPQSLQCYCKRKHYDIPAFKSSRFRKLDEIKKENSVCKTLNIKA